MSDEEYEELLDLDGCSYAARMRRAMVNGWSNDLKSLEDQYCYNGIWYDSKLKRKRANDTTEIYK